MRRVSVAPILLTITLLMLATQVTSSVLADTQQLFSETVVVKNLSIYTITRSIDISGMTNVKLEGSVDLVSGGGSINVYVMDADGYQQYQQNHNARQSSLYIAENAISQALSVPITKSGTYYVILDNQQSLLSSKTVRVQLSLSFDTPFLSSTPFYAIVGVAVVVVVVVAAFVFMRRKRKGSSRLPAAPTMVNTEVGFKKCAFCGSLMHELAKTCPACGNQQP